MEKYEVLEMETVEFSVNDVLTDMMSDIEA